MVGLGDLPGTSFFSLANDVSGDGSVVAGRGYGNSGPVAMLWDEDHGMRDLNALLLGLGLDLTGWRLDEATGISDDGTMIVGAGYHFGNQEGSIAVIPEPGTGLQVGLGPDGAGSAGGRPLGSTVLTISFSTRNSA